jgi:hypothetical protein
MMRSSLDKFPIYAALDVPEVWRYTDREGEIQSLFGHSAPRILPGLPKYPQAVQNRSCTIARAPFCPLRLREENYEHMATAL